MYSLGLAKILYLCNFCLFLSHHLAAPQSHFVKDQKIDAHVFPPTPDYQIPSLPPGHLRPLGYQRQSDGKVKQFGKNKSIHLFQDKIVAGGRPVKMANHYNPPGAEDWGEKYLAKTYGNNPVNVMMIDKKTKNGTSVVQMPFIQFLRKYHYENWVLHGPIPEKMKADLTVPRNLQCPSLIQNLQQVRLWMSSGPIGAPLAARPDDQLWCVLSGRADFIIAKPEFNQHLQFSEKDHPRSGIGESILDVNMINMFDHPAVGNVAWNWAIALKSDCVFIPEKHSHQVRAYGRSYLVIFDIKPQLEYSSCGNTAVNLAHPLVSTRTNWVQSATGEMRFNMGGESKWSVPLIQRALRAIMRKDDRLYVEQFTHFWMRDNTSESRYNAEKAFAAFKILDPNGDGHVTKKNLEKIKLNDWSKLVTIINGETDRVVNKDEL